MSRISVVAEHSVGNANLKKYERMYERLSGKRGVEASERKRERERECGTERKDSSEMQQASLKER